MLKSFFANNKKGLIMFAAVVVVFCAVIGAIGNESEKIDEQASAVASTAQAMSAEKADLTEETSTQATSTQITSTQATTAVKATAAKTETTKLVMTTAVTEIITTERKTASSSTESHGSSAGDNGSVTLPNESENEGNLVWVPVNGGTKYHTKSSCSNMKEPMQVSLETAIENGYEPCKRCH